MLVRGLNAGDVWLPVIGIAVIVSGLTTGLWTLLQALRPRVALRDGYVVFHLRHWTTTRVPVEVVEAFFIGQGPLRIAGQTVGAEKAMNLVARLSQRATDWLERPVSPSFGLWKDGYVTVSGAGCEPIEPELIRRLNRRLKEVKEAKTQARLGQPV